jgi:hypothetical protein
MTVPPIHLPIYHITHVRNLESILRQGSLLSDRAMIEKGGPTSSIGMSNIKQRRLELPVKCHAGDFVGDYVPFYFCPRSVMLYVIHCANHPELAYKGGQDPILHLESDVASGVEWAIANNHRWAFSLSNAGASYTEFRSSIGQLDQLSWPSIASQNFRIPEVKEAKQCEFLVQHSFPWNLISRIGVRSMQLLEKVDSIIAGQEHRPKVEVIPAWYF